MSFENWLVLVTACLAMSISPGTNAMLALTVSVKAGAKKGIWVVAGSLLGFAILTTFAITGAAVFFLQHPGFMIAMKLIGASYLLFLAAKLLLKRHNTGTGGDIENRGIFRQGFLMAVSNPKIILFWLAFAPAILNEGNTGLGFILMVVGTFIVVEGVVETLIVVLGKTIQPFLIKYITRVEAVSAFVFAVFALLILHSAW